METNYVICAYWGKYDDFTTIPMFVCHMKTEADLFVEALNNKESEYFKKVINYFGNNSCIPKDISFGCRNLPVLSLTNTYKEN